ncbi:MAG: ATP-binding protein, partial [Ginsengibacter sp.]
MFLIKRTPERRSFILAVSPFLFSMILTPLIPSSSKIWIEYGSSLVHLEEISGGWLVVVFSWFLLKRYASQEKLITQEKLEKEQIAREKEIQKSELITQQKVELEKTVEERTSELRQSLEELKCTQKQLIQSEKMASLGELTAGIAHEIQNPLNFVNNFSDVNAELITEMKEEIDKGNFEEVKLIANDIEENEQKINHHGKRADAVVKGMLQHSRKSSGQKEPTDINTLADEYLRLSYHGLRANDKTFNATMKTDFDESIGKINIIGQDIGRVLLNLYNNAFYAVNEHASTGSAGQPYEPTVSVSTKKLENHVIITVSDNGNGIPQKIVDKIFQPFFTTKPTGQGTGLGLSLSYDIVKAHGGEIKVKTIEGKGTEFTI